MVSTQLHTSKASVFIPLIIHKMTQNAEMFYSGGFTNYWQYTITSN